jgi:hypothetical protein
MLTVIEPALAQTTGTFDANGSYHGGIQSVAIGFFGNVGVGLNGATCNGLPAALLMTSNPQYKDMLATLLAAQSTGSNVRMYELTSATQTYGSLTFCVIQFVSLGDFPYW